MIALTHCSTSPVASIFFPLTQDNDPTSFYKEMSFSATYCLISPFHRWLNVSHCDSDCNTSPGELAMQFDADLFEFSDAHPSAESETFKNIHMDGWFLELTSCGFARLSDDITPRQSHRRRRKHDTPLPSTVARELDDASNPLFFRFVSVNHSERKERIVVVGGEPSRTGSFCNINFTLIAETVRWILIYLLVRTQVNTLINNKHADTSECYCNINDIPIETSSATPTWHITQCNKVTAIVRQQRKMTKLSNEYNTSRNNCERSRCHPRVIMG